MLISWLTAQRKARNAEVMRNARANWTKDDWDKYEEIKQDLQNYPEECEEPEYQEKYY